MDLIANFERRFVLGVAAMDTTHREFVDLVNRLGTCDWDRFVGSFPALVSHTRAHFAAEEGMMETSGFPAIAEHHSEHARVLGVSSTCPPNWPGAAFSSRVPTCVNSFQTGSPSTQRLWTAHWRPT